MLPRRRGPLGDIGRQISNRRCVPLAGAEDPRVHRIAAGWIPALGLTGPMTPRRPRAGSAARSRRPDDTRQWPRPVGLMRQATGPTAIAIGTAIPESRMFAPRTWRAWSSRGLRRGDAP